MGFLLSFVNYQLKPMLVIAAYCKTSEIMDAFIIISVFVPHAVILM